MKSLAFTQLDWAIAWRHLRAGTDRPGWVRAELIGSLYLLIVGFGLALYAGTLGAPAEAMVSLDPLVPPPAEAGMTPLQGYFGVFGALTIVAAVMGLVFGTLRWFFGLLPTVITMSVFLGCMALVVVLSLMSGLETDLRDKILDQRAHIRVAHRDGETLHDYSAIVEAVQAAPGVEGAAAYLEGEVMVQSGLNRKGAILRGVIPEQHARVSQLDALVQEGSFSYLTQPQDIPRPRTLRDYDANTPWRLRHLKERGAPDRLRERAETKPGAGMKLPAKGPMPAPSARSGEGGSGVASSEGAGETGGSDGADGSGSGAGSAPAQEPAGVADAAGEVGVELPRGGPKGLLRAIDPKLGVFAEENRAADDVASTDPSAGERPLPNLADDDWDSVLPEGEGWEDPSVALPDPPNAVEGDTDPEPLAELPEPPESEEPVLRSEGADDKPVLLGRELASELGVYVGAHVSMITPTGRLTPAGRVPGLLAAKVAGVFFSGMYEFDVKNVYAPLPMVQKFLRAGDRVSGIEVRLSDASEIDAGKAAVVAAVAGLGRPELKVEDWRDLNRNLFSAMFLEKVAMFVALLFVVLVASFGILASNLMSVIEKSKEIAILKTMGAQDAGVLRVFVAEGLCVGILGSGGGIAMGLALSWALDRFGFPLNEDLYYIQELPVSVEPLEVVLVAVAALVIVWLSSLYPAILASRMRPVDGLRQAER